MSKAFTAYDVQKIRLDKLMSNIDKPMEIPERKGGKERKFPDAPDFIRNVMGSSAGAGSGEFHVYRHLRRREYARQRFIEEQAKREEKDTLFKDRMEANKTEAEMRTERRREKRRKKKQRSKDRKRKGPKKAQEEEEEEDEDEDDDDTDEEQDDDKQQESNQQQKASVEERPEGTESGPGTDLKPDSRE